MYFAINTCYIIISMAYIYIRHPEIIELVNERGKFKADKSHQFIILAARVRHRYRAQSV